MIHTKHGGGFCDPDHDFNVHRMLLYSFLMWAPQLNSIDDIPDLKFYCEKGSHSFSFVSFNQATEKFSWKVSCDGGNCVSG